MAVLLGGKTLSQIPLKRWSLFSILFRQQRDYEMTTQRQQKAGDPHNCKEIKL